jgi:hypothetical protein
MGCAAGPKSGSQSDYDRIASGRVGKELCAARSMPQAAPLSDQISE